VVGGQSVTVAQAGAATIVGQVTLRTATGAPVAGVTIGLTGTATMQATTDAGGNYAISNLDSTGTYTVTPVLAGYSFVPVSQTFTNTGTNPTASFTAWPAPRIAALAPAFASVLQPPPASLAAGEIVTLFGTNLCADPAASAVPTLPDRIGACIVQVDGVNIRLYYGSSSQVNAVLPQALALGTHQMVVQRYTDTGYKQLATQSQAFPFTVDRVGMAFVEWKDGSVTIVAAQYTDGGLAGSSRPLRPGDTISLYLTGLGRKAQTFTEGAAPKTTSAAVETIQIVVQGQAAKVLYAGVQSQYPGLDQITLQLPAYTLPAGKQTVTIQISAPSIGQTLSYEVNSN
jgi:uncharacterized protein (TIGR03437 family)